VRDLILDLRFAFRLAVRDPGTCALVLLAVSLAIGANTGIMSFVEAVLYPRFPVKESARLVSIYTSDSSMNTYSSTSYKDYRYYREHSSSLLDQAAFARIRVSWNRADQTEFPWAEIVSRKVYQTLSERSLLVIRFGSPICNRTTMRSDRL
jgi:hypothetical protein